MLIEMHTDVNASIALARDIEPATTAFSPGISLIIAATCSRAPASSVKTTTSASRSLSRSCISAAGRWWKAPTTVLWGSAKAIWAAIEPRGGYRATSSRPSRTSAFTIEITVLSASWARSALTVATALSHGVATTTTSQRAASSFVAPEMTPVPRATSDAAVSLARRASREPSTTSCPALAQRTATPRPAGPVPPKMPTVAIIVLVELGVSNYANNMGLLNDHRILVTGVLTEDSLAFGIAKRALEEGATIALTGAGRGTSLTRRTARKLGDVGEVIELDVTDPAQIEAAALELEQRFGRLDGLVHAIGYAPATCLGGGMFQAPFADVAVAMQISTYSLAALVGAFRPLLQKSEAHGGASVIALDFDGSRAYPMYDWMGVMKAGLESLGRYLAREVGPDRIRVNMLAAGPIRTVAAKSIPGFSLFEDTWAERTPLGWDVHDSSAVADTAMAMLSPLLRGTSASVIHVDGGAHSMG